MGVYGIIKNSKNNNRYTKCYCFLKQFYNNKRNKSKIIFFI